MHYKDKVKHLVSLGFSGDMTQIENYYQGKMVDSSDTNFQKLLKMSESLCKELSDIFRNLNNVKGDEHSYLVARKNQILDILFPGHGMIGNMCDGLQAVIGQVDMPGMGGINANVKFTPYTLVNLGNYSLIGANIQFGDIKKSKTNQQEIGTINIGDDNWICTGVKIASNIDIGNRNVIAMGANVKTSLGDDGLFIGNPANRKTTITHDYKGTKNNLSYRPKKEIDYLISHLNCLGFEGDFDEYIKYLSGERYNCMQEMIGQITDFSHNLSYEYNNPNTNYQRKKEIIEILFPMRGKNLTIGNGLFVDILGSTKLGNNVTIGKNAFFAGNITIGNNVTIGNDAYLSAIGHDVYYKGRHIDTIPGIISEFCVVGNIKVADNVNIGNNCKFVPGCIVSTNIPHNSLILPNGKTNSLEPHDNIR